MDVLGFQIDVGVLLGKAVTLAVAAGLAFLVQRVVVRILRRALDVAELPSASIFINTARTLIWALALLSVMQPVFGYDPQGFVAALGVVSLAVSLGMQDTVSNLIGGISLMVSKAVKPGDQVTVGGVMGEVSDVTWRSTSVRMRGGAVQVIPNSVLSSTALTHVTDWSVGYCAVPLLVKPGANLDAVTAECQEAARVVADKLDPAFEVAVVFTAFTAYGTQGEVQLHVLPDVAFGTVQNAVVRELQGADWLSSMVQGSDGAGEKNGGAA